MFKVTVKSRNGWYYFLKMSRNNNTCAYGNGMKTGQNSKMTLHDLRN
ncbi:hypothetical protein HNP36_002097 [Chryseobacterium shigense]|uniref:Uncharacterized protein n=1 Tax=Chryseobacterium shigense TaxID=297244 RepID=A0A841N8J1_9FLAO|nr:hypothetical protein [Chryseobacterium shigense]